MIWNQNLYFLPSNSNNVMAELKPFQCNATCWEGYRSSSQRQPPRPMFESYSWAIDSVLKWFQLFIFYGFFHLLGSYFASPPVCFYFSTGQEKRIKDACSTVYVFQVVNKWSPSGHQVPETATYCNWLALMLKCTKWDKMGWVGPLNAPLLRARC